MPGFLPPFKKVPQYTVCGKCKNPTKFRHKCSIPCGWFYCDRCGVMTDRRTGRFTPYPGPRK